MNFKEVGAQNRFSLRLRHFELKARLGIKRLINRVLSSQKNSKKIDRLGDEVNFIGKIVR